ncbi:GNAT family N-acetyltransferase [Staphylococcus equorum]|uniref:GNAT family N-acetyltransferase n=1 Tax=Staphylococcus equorum TaxID=246432 RepID=UPI000853D9AA|nr:GNAT family protein [Staphylococcus equorum]OEK69642.1 GNAT family acetyltransferase [Staphylococcus equorum]
MENTNKKTLLEELNEDDLNDYYYWKYLDPLQKSKEWNGPYIEEEYFTFTEFEKKYRESKYLYKNTLSTLAIKYEDDFLGVVTSYWKDKKSRWLECGIVIYKNNKWEKGLGSQVFKEWISYLFKETDANRIGISTWSGNIRMMKVANKTGMIEEARIRKGRVVEGEFYDAIQMGILREEWLFF